MSLAATGATGSYPARLWRLCVMAAALSFASAALAQGATAVRQLASPALAVKAGRQRGISVLDKRRQEEQQEMAAAEAAAAKRKKIIKPTASVATVVDPSLPAGVGIMGRGRSAVNARLTSDGSTVEALQRRRLSLLSKAEFRPMRSVVGVAPAGAGNFDGMPDRSVYAEGPDGEEAWARDMSAFAASNFRGKGVELRTLDQHELKSGLFGFWHEKCGHGKCVEWVQAENGWHLCMVESDGMPVVPSVEAAISWVLQMAKGDKK